MLKQINNASLECIYSDVDVKIKFDDGKWFQRHDPKIRSFTRRKRKPINVAAKFVILFNVGKYAEMVHEKQTLDYVTLAYTSSDNSIDEVLEAKSNEVLQERILNQAQQEPYCFTFKTLSLTDLYWLYQDKFYKDTTGLKVDEVKALITTRQRAQKARINRAKTIASTPETLIGEQRRGFISEDIRLLVWQRDGGKCAKCGSRTELQFDHIIPFSLGGGSSEDNLQILCGSCNRAKSNSIA